MMARLLVALVRISRFWNQTLFIPAVGEAIEIDSVSWSTSGFFAVQGRLILTDRRLVFLPRQGLSHGRPKDGLQMALSKVIGVEMNAGAGVKFLSPMDPNYRVTAGGLTFTVRKGAEKRNFRSKAARKFVTTSRPRTLPSRDNHRLL
ncbi:hypothetical protein AYO38_11595 [bacterium SCGC AG-212-C10]|nr:hypothetical protein AYO38_11595 [bacterium SCGC AG-212-C10]